METERHVQLFRNGRIQATRIPRVFELDAERAITRRENDRLVIEPVRKKGLLATLATLSSIQENFPIIDAGVLPIDDVNR